MKEGRGWEGGGLRRRVQGQGGGVSHHQSP